MAHGRGGLVHDRVGGRAPALERQVEALELQGEPEQAGVEHAERRLEELLPGLVALEHGDAQRVGHLAGTIPA